jgi:hypothetical protein
VEPNDRYLTALEMAVAVEGVIPPATRAEVAGWLKGEAAAALVRREQMIARATAHLRELERGAAALPIAAESVVPASGTVEKDEPPGVVDLGWSIPPPQAPSPSRPGGQVNASSPAGEAGSRPEPAPAPPASDPPPSSELTGTGALTVPLGSRSPVAAAVAQAQASVAARPKTDGPPRPGAAIGGAPRPRFEPKKPLGAAAPRPLASGPRGTARGPAVPTGSVPNPSLLDGPLWDTNTSTEDIVAGALSAADALGEAKAAAEAAPANEVVRGETPSDATALQPLPTQVLPAPLTAPMLGDLAGLAPPSRPPSGPAEVHSLRDATLPLYQPPAAYLEAAGLLGPPSSQSGSSQGGSSHDPRSSFASMPHGPRASLSHEISGSFAAPVLGVAQPAFGPPSQPVQARPEAEGVSSQVTSVNLTTTDLPPPPLPASHVRKLQLVALASGSVAALVCISLLVILTHSSSPAQATSAATSASQPPVTPTVVTPVSAPTLPPVVMPPATAQPEPSAAETATPSAQPVESAPPSATPPATATAAPAVPTQLPTTNPRPRPSGFLKPQPSSKPSPSAKPSGSTKPKPKK